MITETSRNVTATIHLAVTDAEPILARYMATDKQFRPDYVVVTYLFERGEWRVYGFEVRGPVLKKNGEDSANYHHETFTLDRPGWNRATPALLDGLSDVIAVARDAAHTLPHSA